MSSITEKVVAILSLPSQNDISLEFSRVSLKILDLLHKRLAENPVALNHLDRYLHSSNKDARSFTKWLEAKINAVPLLESELAPLLMELTSKDYEIINKFISNEYQKEKPDKAQSAPKRVDDNYQRSFQCENCGATNQRGSRFCNNCGKEIVFLNEAETSQSFSSIKINPPDKIPDQIQCPNCGAFNEFHYSSDGNGCGELIWIGAAIVTLPLIIPSLLILWYVGETSKTAFLNGHGQANGLLI